MTLATWLLGTGLLGTGLLFTSPPSPPLYAAQRGEARLDISKNEYGFAPGVPHAPKIGERAPDFTLQSATNRPWILSKETAHGAVVVVFYRGYW